MKRLAAVFVWMMLGLMLAVPALAADYDVVILNGRVMDPETNFDDIRNVGIKGGKIAVITQDKIKGKETIDATGLVVAPGFIDGHQHCIEPYAYRQVLPYLTMGVEYAYGQLKYKDGADLDNHRVAVGFQFY